MRKKIISMLVSILLIFNCISPAVGFAAGGGDTGAKLIFKYYDIAGGKYLEEGQPLEVGKSYELELWLENMEYLFGGTIPIHFNNEVVQILSVNNEPLTSEIRGGEDGSYEQYLRKNEDCSWHIKTTESDDLPFISNEEQLIHIDFTNEDGFEGKSLEGSEWFYKIRFKVMEDGQPDIRETDLRDGDPEMGDPIGASFGYMKSWEDEGDIEDFTVENDLKDAVYAVNGVTVTPRELEIAEGATVQLTATVTPEEASNKSVQWSSDDSSVAEVDSDGNVTGVSQGRTRIIVTTAEGGFFDSCMVTVLDPNTPTKPQNLRVVSRTGKSVKLAWTESTGKSGVTGYSVYRDNVKIAEVSAEGELVFEDTDEILVTGQSYQYSVEAHYESAVSPRSDALLVTLTGVKITSVSPSGGRMSAAEKSFYVYYEDTDNEEGATVSLEYSSDSGKTWNEAVIDVAVQEKDTDNKLNYFRFSMTPADILDNSISEYRFKYRVTDKSGCYDEYTEIYTIVFPPLAVTEFEATPGARCITLAWNDTGAFTERYRLYRKLSTEEDWEHYTTITGKDNHYYTDKNVSEDKKYDYYVTAVDSYGQEGARSEYALEVQPGKDDELPEVISISPSSNSKIGGVQEITAVLSDNIGIESVDFEYSVDNGVTWNNFSHNDTGDKKVTAELDTRPIEEERVWVGVIAHDTDGNKSNGQPLREYVIDNKGPGKVIIDKTGSTATTVTLTWLEVEDDDVEYFVVERKTDGGFVQVDGKIYGVLGKEIKNLTPDTEYTFRVVAYDSIGNRGEASDEVEITTVSDSEAPVVVKITPKPLITSKDLTVSFEIKDNVAVGGAKIYISRDKGQSWTYVADVESASKGQNETLYYTIKVNEHEDGSLYIKALPYDTSGNKASDSGYNEYIIDTTAPAAPAEVTATGNEDYIEISWNSADESDGVVRYIVTRSEAENGTYVTLNENVQTLNYIDEDADLGTTYFYRVYAADEAGNVSEYEKTVSAVRAADETKPEIYGAYDMRRKSTAEITIEAEDSGSGVKNIELLCEKNAVERKSFTKGNHARAVFSLEKLKLSDGKVYKFTAKVSDEAGNESEKIFYCTIDDKAPEITKAEAVSNKIATISVNWEVEKCEDLYKTNVYYKSDSESGYREASERGVSETGLYESVIGNLDTGVYSVKITAEDTCGNISEKIIDGISVEGEVQKSVFKVEINAPAAAVVGEEISFGVRKISGLYDIKTVAWDFNDGGKSESTEPTHRFANVGTYNVLLQATDESGRSVEAYKQIVVSEKEDLSELEIIITDDDGNKVSGANVIFNIGDEENKTKYITDRDGAVKLTAMPGTYKIGVYAEGYLPTEKSVTLIKNVSSTKLEIRIVKKNITIGNLTWKRMTLKEIEEEGIDPEAPENQNLYKYKMSIIIGKETVNVEGYKPVSSDQTKETPIVITNKDYTTRPTDINGNYINSTVYVYDFNPKENGYEYDKDTDKNKAPTTIVSYVEIPGEAKWLKEFFDVKLTVTNQAEEKYVLENCSATLNIRDGLTLMSEYGASDSLCVGMGTDGSIKGQQTCSVNWILRGDKKGEYPIWADFSGVLGGGFDIPINARFESKEPIKVYGDEGLSLVVEYEDEIVETDDYMVRVGLANNSVLTRDLVSVSLDEPAVPVVGWQNYIEISDEMRFKSDTSSLKYGETMYSDYTIDGISSNDEILGIVTERLLESNTTLPVQYKAVKPRSFHSRSIDVYVKGEDGRYTTADSIEAYPGDEISFKIEIREMLPGESAYTAAADGTEVYLDGTCVGETKDGIVEYTYKIPNTVKNENKKLVFKGNRTDEQAVLLHIINNKTTFSGKVSDIYGNLLAGAKVSVGNRTVTTDSNGQFDFGKHNLEAGKTVIEISKDKYKTVSEELNLPAGEYVKNFSLERIRNKPKITSVKFGKTGTESSKHIIPEGLNIEEELTIEASVPNDGSVQSVALGVKASNGETKEIATSNTNKVTFNTAVLSAGDILYVTAQSDDGTVSTQYMLPVEIVEAPFTNLLNDPQAGDKVVSGGKITMNVRFAKLFNEKFTKGKNGGYEAWLTGDAWDSWKELFDKFKAEITLDAEGGKLSGTTELIIDWFKYKNYTTYVSYDFATGRFTVSPLVNYWKSYSTELFRDPYGFGIVTSDGLGSKIGEFRVNEVVDEDILSASNYKYSSLQALNNLYWKLNGLYGVDFTLEDDSWKGNFTMGVDQTNRFVGRYTRKLSRGEYIKGIVGGWSMPQYLLGSWQKELNSKNTVQLTLGEEDNADFGMNYQSNTFAAWTNGMSTIHLNSMNFATISMLPELRVSGVTWLNGGYYVLGFWHNIFVEENVIKYYSWSEKEGRQMEPLNMVSYSGGAEPGKAVFPNAETAVTNGQNPTVVYLAKDADGNSLLASGEFNGTWNFSDEPVAQNGTQDYNPALANIGEKQVAVWADMSTSELPENGAMSEEAIKEGVASKLRIAASVKQDGSWSEAEILSTSDYVSYSPAVSECGDGIMAAWIENADNQINGEDRDDRIMYSIAEYDEESEEYTWSEPQSIFGEGYTATISELSLVNDGKTTYVMYAAEEAVDSENEDAGTIKKYYVASYNAGWSPYQKMNNTSEPDRFAGTVMMDGEAYAMILTDTKIHVLNMLTKVSTTYAMNDTLKNASDATFAYNAQYAAITWIGSTADGQRLYTMSYNISEDEWSEPVEVETIEEGYCADNIKAVFAGNELQILYNVYKYSTEDGMLEGVWLCNTERAFDDGEGIEVLSVTALDTAAKDKDMRFKVEVKNNSVNKADGYSVTLVLDGGYEDGKITHVENIEKPLAGGASDELEIRLNLGAFSKKINVKATASLTDTGAARSGRASSSGCDVPVVNTQLGEISCSQQKNDVKVTVPVKKLGEVAAEKTVELYVDDQCKDSVIVSFAEDETMKTAEFTLSGINDTISVKAKIKNTDDEINLLGKIAETSFTPVGRFIEGNIIPFINSKYNGGGIAKDISIDANLSVVYGEDDVVPFDNSISYDGTEKLNNISVNIPANENVNLLISADGYVDRTIKNAGKDTNFENLVLIAGDVDNNGVVNIRDIITMIRAYNTRIEDNEDYKHFDYDQSGVIDTKDLLCLLPSYGASDYAYEYWETHK